MLKFNIAKEKGYVGKYYLIFFIYLIFPEIVYCQGIQIDGSGGGLIAFYSERKTVQSAEIFIMNADGSGLKQLTDNTFDDSTPSLSPDGTKILFSSTPSDQSDIYSMNIDGSEVRQLTYSAEGNEYHAEWSPDQSMIVYTVFSSGSWTQSDIFLMYADGNGKIQLTDHPGNDMRPSFSPDGKLIIFNSNRDGNVEIYTMKPDGSEVKRLTNTPLFEYFPMISPDGKKIVYTLFDPDKRTADIYVMNMDGTENIKLTFKGRINEDARWSPDGGYIIFQSERTGWYQIFIMDANGDNQRCLSDNTGNDYWPCWSRYEYIK